ncbi:hypothetical protein [Paracoccus sphaerophysae]|uniref:Uncharacterized protein n=1 Tax=Paracoccus sphaerophysae TaxID=690417 RepID=A0A099FFR2_9RHOB|nr:hypothetical protein [Paracoccus sphaerophysae]KGJ09018.1 hypothetical protein IC63_03080 [Paracoccus sphaerophysae]
MMGWPEIIAALGGGARGVAEAGMAFVVWRLWSRLVEVQDKLSDVQQTASKELREMQSASHTALAANTSAIAALTAAVQTMGRDRG